MKTTSLAALVALGAFAITLVATHLPLGLIQPLLAVGWSVGLVAGVVTAAGLVVLWRDRAADDRDDLFLRLNRSCSEERLARGEVGLFARFLRAVWPGGWRRFRVGDEVEVRSLAEIQGTLDGNSALEGLPFQPEMVAYCGRRFRVYRRIDKIHDYGRSGLMRRIEHAVSLVGLRCDGAAHGSCQARCSLIWKDAWLRPVSGSIDVRGRSQGDVGAPAALTVEQSARRFSDSRPLESSSPAPPGERRFRCQFTELAAASVPMRAWDIRQDLRPLVAGNVTLFAFGVAILTRLFNQVQRLRHGVTFPWVAKSAGSPVTAAATPVAPGARVKVRGVEEIAMTLDARGRNRGLWFDLDMPKFCGRTYDVAERVEKLIDSRTGRMLHMKSPCLTLGGVAASGEMLRFCSQHEQILWREVWLRPVERDVQTKRTLVS